MPTEQSTVLRVLLDGYNDVIIHFEPERDVYIIREADLTPVARERRVRRSQERHAP